MRPESPGRWSSKVLQKKMTINVAATRLYVADGDNYVTACNAVTGAAIGNPFLFAPSPLSSAVPVLPALTPTGRYLYVPQVNPAGSGYQVVMLNALSGAIVGSPITVGNVPVAAAMAPKRQSALREQQLRRYRHGCEHETLTEDAKRKPRAEDAKDATKAGRNVD